MSASLETLRTVPCLHSLYHLLQRVGVEQPTKILTADSPFFVDEHGGIYDGPVLNASFISKRSFQKGSALIYELEIIAEGIAQGVYTQPELDLFQQWAQYQMTIIRKALRQSDMHEARKLKRQNLLN